MASLEQFKQNNPKEFMWLEESAQTFDFARSVFQSLKRYGGLTPNQFATVQRLCAQAETRKAQIVAKSQSAPTVDIGAIAQSLSRAHTAGLKTPKLRLDSFVFSRAPDSGVNAGAVYVKEAGEYLGKIVGGKLFALLKVSKETEERIIDVAKDPMNSAIAYGKKFGRCAMCNRDLTLEESVDRGMGAHCAKKYGW